MVATGDEQPRRRVDDCVSWRDMTSYVDQRVREEHDARAELSRQMSIAIEKLEASFRSYLESIDTRFGKHEAWHRDVLQGLIDRQPATSASRTQVLLQVASTLIAAAAVIVAVIAISGR